MMRFSRKILVTAFLVLGLTNCSKNQQSYIPQTTDQHDEKIEMLLQKALADSLIHVVDDRANALAQAKITINGQAFTTNDKGDLEIPEIWKEATDVLIQKDGYVSAAYLAQKAVGHVFELHKAPSQTQNTVKGAVSGFGPLPNDGFIDFALNTKSMSAQNYLNFDIAQIISPVMDDISIMGKTLRIPTNIYLPSQDESYLFFTLTLEKEFYRLFYNDTGATRIHSSRGKFDFRAVKDKLEGGGNFFEAVNDFQFLSVGDQDVQIGNGETKLDINSSKKVLDQKIDFTATNNTASSLFGVSLFKENGDFNFCDIKLHDPKQKQKLSVPATATDRYILLVLADKKAKGSSKLAESFSTALTPAVATNSVALMERIAVPQATSTTIKMQKPTIHDASKEFATLVTLSNIDTKNVEGAAIESKTPLLEIYASGWTDSIDYSKFIEVKPGPRPYRWDVSFFAIDSQNEKQFNGPSTLNQATHTVHNALNL